MKQVLTNWRFIGSVTALIYSVVLFFSCRFGPVFSGDTIQYLNLANKIKNGEWPASEKWLQLYPALISMVDLLCNDLIISAIIVNAMLLSVIIFTLNYLVYRLFNNYKLNIILGLLLLADRELYFHSMTIMAEICLLALLLVLYVFIFKIIERHEEIGKFNFIPIVVFSALMLFAKFNAIIAFVVVSFFLFIYSGKKIIWPILYLLCIAILYGIHAFYFNTHGVFTQNFSVLSQLSVTGFIQGFHQCISILIEYFTSPSLGELYLNVNNLVSILVFIAVAWFFVFNIKKKGTTNQEFMILLFVLLYVLVFIVVAKSSKGAQIDLRQMFIPVFVLNICLFLKIYQWKSNLKYLAMTAMLMLGSYKSLRRFQAFKNVGYGDSNISMEGWRDFQVIQAAKQKIASAGIANSAIYTNKFKSLGVDFGFIELGKPPNLGHWTDEGYLSPANVDFKRFFQNQIYKDNGILIYVLDDFREMFNVYKQQATEDVQLQLFAEGFIVFKRSGRAISPQT